ncbi:MAG: CHAT domain-containing protein [Lewinellaceae bacterium]|nr:CHAT domain-containing protein [Lewinellaceae bacterium]
MFRYRFHFRFFLRALLLTLVLLSAFQGLEAQDSNSGAFQLLERADSLNERGDDDGAKKMYSEAIIALQKAGDLSNWCIALRNYAKLLADRQHQPFQAQQLLQEALSRPFRTPQNKAEYSALCKTHLRLAHIGIKKTGDIAVAKQALLEALAIYDAQLESKETADIAEYIFLQLGIVLTRLREYEGAAQIYQRGIDFSFTYQVPFVAKYNDFGDLYVAQGKDSLALAVFAQGHRRKGLDDYEKTLLYFGEAECYTRLGRMAAAQQANEKAGALLKAHPPESEAAYWRCTMYLFENRAIFASKNKDRKLALKSFEQAIVAARKAPENIELRMPAGFMLNQAEIWQELSRPDSALAAIAQALRLLLPGRKFEPGELLIQDQIRPENMLIRALQLQAEAFAAQGNPERALLAYELIPGVENALRANHDYERSTLLALQDSRRRINRAIEIAWGLYEKSENSNFAQRAFHLSEHARGLLLLEGLARAQADFKLPEGLAREEHDFQVKVKWYELALAEARQGNDIKAVHQMEQQLDQYKRKQAAFVEQLKDQVPGYAETFREPELVQAADMAGILPENAALLAYYLTDVQAYIFGFGPGGQFSWRKADLPADFRETVRDYVAYMSKLNENSPAKAVFLHQSYALCALLALPEIKAFEGSRSLIIVPDDVLSFLPFETLSVQDVNKNWPDQPFLLRQHPVSYAYSVSLLRVQQQITRTPKGGRRVFAGFAPAYHVAASADQQVANLMREGMYNLQGTHVELAMVHALIGGDAFDDSLATEQRFKAVAANYRILLLSMHGFANEDDPILSRMLFGDAQTGQPDDNILYASELQVMRLQADLAVLSACHTGFGRWHKGEGVYSLARAFAAAGVPATVMSLWRLPDNTAPQLMEAFFKNLKSGLPKDQALQMAKLQFLDNPDNFELSHPGFWAGVVANGDMSALHFGERSWLWWLLIPVLVLSGWFWWRKRRGGSGK